MISNSEVNRTLTKYANFEINTVIKQSFLPNCKTGALPTKLYPQPSGACIACMKYIGPENDTLKESVGSSKT